MNREDEGRRREDKRRTYERGPEDERMQGSDDDRTRG
jgi:hypothetical protein